VAEATAKESEAKDEENAVLSVHSVPGERRSGLAGGCRLHRLSPVRLTVCEFQTAPKVGCEFSQQSLFGADIIDLR